MTGGSSSSGGSEKTDLNCSFKISALSLGLSHNVPLYFSEVTPIECFDKGSQFFITSI